MKKRKKIVFIVLLLIFVGIFIHPERIVYEPKIEGKVLNLEGKPIENATVSRIEEKSWKNEKFGYYEYEEFISQTVKTDKNGKFELTEKSRIEWIHNMPFHLLVVLCNAEFEVSKSGFETYRTEYGEFEEQNKNHNACKGIEFKAEIILKKI